MLKYFSCYSNKTKPKMVRQNTPYPRQSIIDIDNGTIEIKSKHDSIKYEYLPYSAVLHAYKK
jgi:hypothetical protein